MFPDRLRCKVSPLPLALEVALPLFETIRANLLITLKRSPKTLNNGSIQLNSHLLLGSLIRKIMRSECQVHWKTWYMENLHKCKKCIGKSHETVHQQRMRTLDVKFFFFIFWNSAGAPMPHYNRSKGGF